MTLRILSLLWIMITLAIACGEKPSAEKASDKVKPVAAEEATSKTYEQAPSVAMMPHVQKGAVSGTQQVGEWALGPELAPAESAASDTILEAFHTGEYKSMDEATTVSLVRTAEEPGQKATGDFALKVIREQPGVSGVTSEGSQIQFKAGRRYLMHCWINAGAQAGDWRMGASEPGGTVLWAENPNGIEDFAAATGQWTELTGVLTVPGDKDLLASLQIVRQNETVAAWYLDGVSVCEILEPAQP